jgi:hypothetical protein
MGAVVWLALGAAGVAGQTAPDSGGVLFPKNATAIEGVPSVRVDASPEGATRRQLDSAEAARQSLKIDIVNGEYVWSSRERRPLTLTSSGEFTYLTSTEPGRYIRVRRVNDRLSYVEHVDMGPRSVTYWGELRIVLGK